MPILLFEFWLVYSYEIGSYISGVFLWALGVSDLIPRILAGIFAAADLDLWSSGKFPDDTFVGSCPYPETDLAVNDCSAQWAGFYGSFWNVAIYYWTIVILICKNPVAEAPFQSRKYTTGCFVRGYFLYSCVFVMGNIIFVYDVAGYIWKLLPCLLYTSDAADD